MKIIGFNFDKICIEKFSSIYKDLTINSHIDIKDIKEAKSEQLNIKEDILGIKFTFKIDYSPKIAVLDFAGGFIVTLDPKDAKNLLKAWKDKKQVPDEYRVPLFNIILRKSSLKALQLEEEFSLPLHFNLPSIKKEE